MRLAKHWSLIAIGVALIAIIAGAVQYQRHRAAIAAEEADEREESEWLASIASSPAPPQSRPSPKAREVYATWYDVPDASLAKRRAGDHELTAAHNRLPIGTLVRVTNPANGKSVLVRITDRGIRDRRVKIDVCKEAAVELDFVHKGVTRLRLEVVPDEHAGASPVSQQGGR